MRAQQTILFDTEPVAALIPGRVYAPEFPGRDEEQELLQISQSLPLHAARHQQ